MMTETTVNASQVPSALQQTIIDEITFGAVNLVVVARAGTGKTTTIVNAVKKLLRNNPDRVVTVCAFSKDIANELVARFKGYPVIVKTLHAIGFDAVKRWIGNKIEVSFGNDRANFLAEKVCGMQAPDEIKKLVATLCTKGREMAPHARNAGELIDIAIRFECEPDDSWAFAGFGIDYVERKALEAMEYAATNKPTMIDGSDMIFLPVRNNWLVKNTDDCIVDEAQDMNVCQLEIAQKITRNRVILVGDDRQAIFGFRGADSESLNRLQVELNAKVLPLNVTYRCGNAIVREAQAYVPDFMAGENNHEGLVRSLRLDPHMLTNHVDPGDFILSRVNAPLVSIAMSLLRQGKRTRIAGKDIGKGLITLIRKMKAKSVPDLMKKIATWETRELRKVEARYAEKKGSSVYENRVESIKDQAAMLTEIADNAPSVNEVTARLEALFTNDGLGDKGVITCSSVHKSKGLEADRVFILADTLRSNNQEELNICYVAITRAKHELVYVTED